jgi:GTPase
MLPLVAIVGRPNVGKSTLFNRLIGKRQALVADEPGMTRDRHYGTAIYEERPFHLVDTGGFDPEAVGMDALIRHQTELAIDEADVVLFLMDARAGLTGADETMLQLLRKGNRPLVCATNKMDGPKQQALIGEFYSLGVKEIFGISAEHALGMEGLIDAILDALPKSDDEKPDEDERIKLALIGRPNAGKSALLNHLIGSERSIVSDIPGTTRDPVDVELDVECGKFQVIDTAGIRRKKRSGASLEKLAVLRALRAVGEADVACLVIDSHAGISAQDSRIANLTLEAGCGLVLVYNKSDLFDTQADARKQITQLADDHLSFVTFAPGVTISAISGKGVHRVLPTAARVHRSCSQRISTSEVNRWLGPIEEVQPPPAHNGRQVRLYYATQVKTRPPSFLFSTNDPDGIPSSYRRFLHNRLREAFKFEGAPLRLFFRKRGKDKSDSPSG